MTRGIKKILCLLVVAGILAVCAVWCFDHSAAAQAAQPKSNPATTQAGQSKSWELILGLFQKESLIPTDVTFSSVSGIVVDRMVVLRHDKPKEQQYCRIAYDFAEGRTTGAHVITQYTPDPDNRPVQEQFRRFAELAGNMGSVVFKVKPRLGETEPRYKVIRPEKGLPLFSMRTITIRGKRGYLGIVIDFPPDRPIEELTLSEELEFETALKRDGQGGTSTTRDSSERSYPKFGEIVIPMGADWRTVLKVAPKTATVTIYDMEFEEFALPTGTKVISCNRPMTFENGRLQKFEMDVGKDAETMLAYLDKDKRESGSRNLTLSKSVMIKLEWKKADDGMTITLSRQTVMPDK